MLWLSGTRQKLLNDPKRLGRWGEKRCLKFLKKKGYTLVTRNYRTRMGEIDLIMSDRNGAIVFVEVKTRTSEERLRAEEAVTPKKRHKMNKTAKYFIKIYGIKDKPLRFDVVAIVLSKTGPAEIRHYKNAFRP